MATAAPTKRREVLRLSAALVMAIVGGAVAFMAPSAVTPGTPDAAGVVWRVGAGAGVLACLLVAGSSVLRLSGRRESLSKAVIGLGWATIVGLFLAAIHGVLTDVPGGDAMGMSFVVAIPAVAAIVLTLVGQRLVEPSTE